MSERVHNCHGGGVPPSIELPRLAFTDYDKELDRASYQDTSHVVSSLTLDYDSSGYLFMRDSPENSTPNDSISMDSGDEDLDDRDEGNASLCSRRLTFLMTCISPSTDAVNLFRYPYIVYKHGGIILIPCIIVYTFIGLPLYYLEQTLGRLHGGKKGGGQCLGHLVPIFKGVGFAYVTFLALIAIYYMGWLSWTLLYLFSSMNEHLPWSHCGQNETYTSRCPSRESTIEELCLPSFNSSSPNDTQLWYRSPSEMFFHETVTKLSSHGHYNPWSISWPLTFALLGGWLINFFNLIKGKISFRKTAILPAAIMVLLLSAIFGSITGDLGYQRGLHYYFKMNFSKLKSADVWNDATTQVVLCLGTGSGLVQLIGRRGHKYRGLVHDAVTIVIVNIIAAFFCGLVVFTCLGYVASATDRTCVHFLREGFGLTLTALPAGMINLPLSVICSILLFLMVAILSFSRIDGIILTLLICLLDKFSNRSLRRRHWLLVLSVCALLCALGIITTSPIGIRLMQVVDSYVFSWCGLCLGLLECIVITRVYSYNQFAEDVDTILQQRLSNYWKYLWSYITPAAIITVLMLTLIQGFYRPLGVSEYIGWAPIVGWILLFLVLIQVPLHAVIAYCKTYCMETDRAEKERKNLLTPTPICDSMMKWMRRTSKDMKDPLTAPRILVMRNQENRNGGGNSFANRRLRIPYGFVVCPEKAPKSGKNAGNKGIFSFPNVDKTYALTDSNIRKLTISPRVRMEEIQFYTPQTARRFQESKVNNSALEKKRHTHGSGSEISSSTNTLRSTHNPVLATTAELAEEHQHAATKKQNNDLKQTDTLKKSDDCTNRTSLPSGSSGDEKEMKAPSKASSLSSLKRHSSDETFPFSGCFDVPMKTTVL